MANRRLQISKRKKYKKLKIAKKSSLVRVSVKGGYRNSSDNCIAGLTGASLGNIHPGGGSSMLARAARQHSPGAPMKTKGKGGTARKKKSVRVRVDPVEQIRRERSLLLKRHMRERVALRDHTRELEQRRASMRRGADAKTERRELGKYIRELKNEQRTKHAAERSQIEAQMAKVVGAASAEEANGCAAGEWEDVNSSEDDQDDEVVGESELHDMFAHLMT